MASAPDTTGIEGIAGFKIPPCFSDFDEIVQWHLENQHISWHSSSGSLCPRYDGYSLSVKEFWREHLCRNRACVVQSIGSNCWSWYLQFVDTHETENAPQLNLAGLSQAFGDVIVDVADCFAGEGSERISMTVNDFLMYLQRHRQGEDTRLLYLKDFHAAARHRTGYTTPEIFREDWLNEWLDSFGEERNVKQDYRFLYLGPAGSWTPLHADVFRSYSWSVNLYGRKCWHLYPPEETSLAFQHEEELYKCNTISTRKDEYPIRVSQSANEAIFVPSGWYHRVYNIDDALSVNHNWLHPLAMHFTLSMMVKDLREAEEAISDCRELCDSEEEFRQLCRRNQAIVSGLSFEEMQKMLKYCMDKRSDVHPSPMMEANLYRARAIYDALVQMENTD